MRRFRLHFWPCLLMAGMLLLASVAQASDQPTARDLVEKAFLAYRGKASVGTMTMTIHRPDWERAQTIKAWTRGERETLVTTLEPARDRGNGTLKIGDDMWIFNPKVNRIIKLPPSMMSQSWMGSDFSNNDLAKSDSILRDYDHRIIGSETQGGQTVYTIESKPHAGAAVVWGKQVLTIRADGAFLQEIFYDEDGQPVKTLSFQNIEIKNGLPFAYTLIMTPSDKKDRYTRIQYTEIAFPASLPDRVFTQTALRHPPAEAF